ncbi:MAG: hypothetical protein NZ602_03230 [Thermoguttaceae bacterium]|nr:hypothetical protein [Thermoguttaceae bacterium]MDW8037919.1 hypothetical protein [Thermoguttaceae bacterium]
MDPKVFRHLEGEILKAVPLRRRLGWMFIGAMVWLGGGVSETILAEEAPLAKETPPAQENHRPSVIHITDLYRPPADPDDHFDLVCAFALAKQGYIDLAAVVIEAPKPDFAGDPDVMAVAQLNRLTGLAVPVVAGMPASVSDPWKKQSENGTPLTEWIKRALPPVVLISTGSCRDVAQAAKECPSELFAGKVRAVYVNAGLGSPEPAYQSPLEYNVALDPKSYQEIFSLPSPVYWLPCFEGTNTGLMWRSSRHASLYRFRQEEVFSKLSAPVQNYFLWMLEAGSGPAGGGKQSWFWQHPTRWLRALEGPPDPDLLARHGRSWRSMWSTASQLHAAGLTVTRDGRLVPVKEAGDSAVFDFVPVEVQCTPEGVTHWRELSTERSKPAVGKPPQFILRILDIQAYPTAMTRTLGNLLQGLVDRGPVSR